MSPQDQLNFLYQTAIYGRKDISPIEGVNLMQQLQAAYKSLSEALNVENITKSEVKNDDGNISDNN